MLSRIEVQNPAGDTLALPFRDTSGGYVVKSIDGLGPVKAELVSTKTAPVDGGILQATRRDTRNIVMRLGITPTFAVNTATRLREYLYRFLLPKYTVQLLFYDDDVLTYIATGTVETFDTNIFGSDPEVSVSLICFDPDFYAPFPNILEGETVTTMDEEAMEYFGMANAGIILVSNITEEVPGITLHLTRPDNVIHTMNVEVDLFDGDVVTINSIPGSKSVTLNRSGIESSLLYTVEAVPSWAEFSTGINTYRLNSTVAGMPYTLSHTVKYSAI